MGWWKADPVPEPPQSQSQSATSSSPISPHPLPTNHPSSATSASACPVDEKTRSIWLQAAQQKAQSKEKLQSQLPPSHPTLPLNTSTNKTQPSSTSSPIAHPSTYASSKECSSDRISQSPSHLDQPVVTPSRPLSHQRQISTIPRALPSTAGSTIPANSEAETGASTSGNWIYPSENQFYNAVMRKQTAASESDLLSSISHIIPIHNAVNERAWFLIKNWEGSTSDKCGGPKLASFQGLGAGALSPKARMRSLVGYTQPFDRHDWVVERCGGEKVEYVIDFYQGKAASAGNGSSASGAAGAGGAENGKLNFYLDVRPKLNSVEGCKMRVERFFGWR